MSGLYKKYKIKGDNIQDVMIVSKNILESLISQISDSETQNIRISTTKLISTTYMNYVISIININRNRRGFQYKYIEKRDLNKDDIYKILQNQFSSLKIENENCFYKVDLIYLSDQETVFDFKCTKESFSLFTNRESVFTYKGQSRMEEELMIE